MSQIFFNCSFLKELNLSNFDTDMNFMFSYCSSLKKLNLSNFDSDNISDMRNMFFGTSTLSLI